MKHGILTLFSICTQAAIGIIVFVGLGCLVQPDFYFNSAVLIAALLSVLGIIISLLKLGHPMRAPKALANYKTSWLSREIMVTSVFAGVSVIAALIILIQPTYIKAIFPLSVIAAVIGLINVYVMSSIYRSSIVPAWQHGGIVVEFYAATLSMGAVVFYVLSANSSLILLQILPFVVAVIVAVQVAAMVWYYIDLGTKHSAAAKKSMAILSDLSPAMLLKWVLIVFGAALSFIPAMAVVSMILLLIGQFIGRHLFFAAEVSPEVGLN